MLINSAKVKFRRWISSYVYTTNLREYKEQVGREPKEFFFMKIIEKSDQKNWAYALSFKGKTVIADSATSVIGSSKFHESLTKRILKSIFALPKCFKG